MVCQLQKIRYDALLSNAQSEHQKDITLNQVHNRENHLSSHFYYNSYYLVSLKTPLVILLIGQTSKVALCFVVFHNLWN